MSTPRRRACAYEWTGALAEPGRSQSSGAASLFREEYRLPLVSPQLAALVAACAEHLLPVLIPAGLATRLSALGLLVMTLVIQVFVYPDAYPAHGVWGAVLLLLVARGAGVLSIDHLIARHDADGP